ncbi:MAG TPA: secondary thiamine-phosphate synthase enzyme YjbQ [Syntrophorhabdaceae bacterium]|nr:secondary thiamine-phosphate synthase enzyme YjbQ [Syntrophorhabdaceae bacterium]
MIELRIKTTRRNEALNITSRISGAIKETEGKLLCVYTPHTTCGLVINEQADPDVMKDIISALDSIAPADYPYKHVEGNSDAHIKAILTGASVSVPMESGRIKLGTWQGIFLMEFDGPRERKILLTIL